MKEGKKSNRIETRREIGVKDELFCVFKQSFILNMEFFILCRKAGEGDPSSPAWSYSRHPKFYVSICYQNSGSHSCVACTLPTRP